MRLHALVTDVSSLRYFSDASALESYDLLARSAFARVVLANRRRFDEIVFLTWAEGVSSTARALVAVLGEPIEILTDEALRSELGHLVQGRLVAGSSSEQQRLEASIDTIIERVAGVPARFVGG